MEFKSLCYVLTQCVVTFLRRCRSDYVEGYSFLLLLFGWFFFILFPLQTCECYDSRISLVMFVVWYAFSNLLVCTPDLMSLSDSSSLAQWSTSAPDSNGHSSKQASSIKWITNGFSCFSAASSNKKRTLKNSSFFSVGAPWCRLAFVHVVFHFHLFAPLLAQEEVSYIIIT